MQKEEEEEEGWRSVSMFRPEAKPGYVPFVHCSGQGEIAACVRSAKQISSFENTDG